MKRLLFIAFTALNINIIAQTNTFPTSGNVGIGTDNPLNGLNVFKLNDYNGGSIRFGYSATYDGLLSLGWNPSTSRDAMKFSYFPHNSVLNQIDLMTLDIIGNVGIGTTNPMTKLEVFNSAQGGHLTLSTNDNPNADLSRIDLDYKIANTNQIIGRISSAYLNSANGGSGALRLYTSNNGVLGEKMKIDNNGNVGIGISSPQYKLDVNGSTNINGNIIQSTTSGYNSFSSGLRIDVGGGTNNALYVNGDTRFGCDFTGPKTGVIKYNTNLDAFIIDTWSSGKEVRIGGSKLILGVGEGSQLCNVGIGTQNPDYKLDVLGTIRAKEVLVNLDGGADFVFEKDYKLLPIEHVATYVQENKHLPDIPSANEMVKNGVSMGDMQVKLLQKVEELTLYAIQQNSKLQDQGQKLLDQEKKNKELELELKVLKEIVTKNSVDHK